MTFIEKNRSAEQALPTQKSDSISQRSPSRFVPRMPFHRNHRRPWFFLGTGFVIGVGIVLSVCGIAWNHVIDTIHSLGL